MKVARFSSPEQDCPGGGGAKVLGCPACTSASDTGMSGDEDDDGSYMDMSEDDDPSSGNTRTHLRRRQSLQRRCLSIPGP